MVDLADKLFLFRVRLIGKIDIFDLGVRIRRRDGLSSKSNRWEMVFVFVWFVHNF